MVVLCVLLAALTSQAETPAQLPKPSASQLEWENDGMGMFLHFAPNTWQDQEYDHLTTPFKDMDPKNLSTDQWCRVAKSMGARYIVFVAKHVGGFCWWQTKTTKYSVKSLPWENGHGDVMKDLEKSCKKYGLKLGVYLSPADHYHHVLVGGKAEDPAYQATYIKMFRQQLTELLTHYGPIFEIWFDGSLKFDVSDLIKKYDPNAVVFQGPSATIRWVGNEAGQGPDPCWNGAVYNPKTWGTLTAQDGVPGGDRWLPNEVDTTMRDSWFWNTKNEPTIKTLPDLMSIYVNSVGRGCNLLLNNTPDTTGAIPAPDVARAKEFGAEIKKEFGFSVVESHGSGAVIDAMPSAPVTIDSAISMEDIAKGQRVRSYVIEGLVDGKWVQLAKGTSIGHEKIDLFDPVKVSDVRLRILDAVGTPQIKRFALFRANSLAASN